MIQIELDRQATIEIKACMNLETMFFIGAGSYFLLQKDGVIRVVDTEADVVVSLQGLSDTLNSSPQFLGNSSYLLSNVEF